MRDTRPAGRLLLTTVAATALLGIAPALAVDEIIVTAQKREQSLQDVPIAVSAFDSTTLMNAGVRDIRELVALAPSLVLTSSASEAAGAVARVRGIGTTGDNPGLESAVGIFIDGVYRNRTNVGLTELGDVERIEILRGPQGTLFGRNTSAGLINIVTKKPSLSESSGYGEVSYGFEYDEFRAAAGITAPLVTDILGGKLDVVYHERDGYIEDVNSSRRFNDRSRYLVRGQLQYEPTADFSLRFIADFSDREENCCASVTSTYGATVPIIDGLAGSHGHDGIVQRSGIFVRQTAVTPGRGYQQDVTEWGLSGEANWDLGFGTLTSITAYRDWDAKRSQDIDFSGADILYRDEDGYTTHFKTFTQELRLAGKWDRLDWLVGAFVSSETLELNDAIKTGADFEVYLDTLLMGALATATGIPLGMNFTTGGGGVRNHFDQDADSWALFTHDVFAITDRLDLIAGVRYTSETKELDASVYNNNPACLAAYSQVLMGNATAMAVIGNICIPFFNSFHNGNAPSFNTPGIYTDENTEREWSGTIGLAYDVTPNWLVYGSYGRGYKGGGYNLDNAGLDNPLTGATAEATDLAFKPEFVDAYEIGSKNSFFNNELTINTALFYEDFSDFQLNTFNGVNFVVQNLEEATSTGVEIEAIGRPTDGLVLLGGVTYADTKYGDDLGTSSVAQPLKDRQLTNAPLWVLTAAVSYKFPLWNTGLSGLVHLDGRYSSGYNTGSDLDTEKEQKGFTVPAGSASSPMTAR
ncbi:MAG: TonB-dependent receptor [Alphaproteobacteria bacterium]|nr:TonB-dependent receptor [Alphaproteobacteria bacterium]